MITCDFSSLDPFLFYIFRLAQLMGKKERRPQRPFLRSCCCPAASQQISGFSFYHLERCWPQNENIDDGNFVSRWPTIGEWQVPTVYHFDVNLFPLTELLYTLGGGDWSNKINSVLGTIDWVTREIILNRVRNDIVQKINKFKNPIKEEIEHKL